jgi:hypothetical protein
MRFVLAIEANASVITNPKKTRCITPRTRSILRPSDASPQEIVLHLGCPSLELFGHGTMSALRSLSRVTQHITANSSVQVIGK